jgi:UDP-N-acetylglucosamine--N-acetylmuramyl-(pentapeptide) pyrophosphoryl-undecaprenol N-acetylglucosamine transferase
MKKRIILTGGGSTGHVAVNLALIPYLLERNWEIYYIGSTEGIEVSLIKEFKNVTYFPISTGKLRRYIDIKNFKDPFNIVKGFMQSRKIIKRIQPSIIFSKGGFVSVPVILAGASRKIPIISHESDITPGLANKLSLPFVQKICYTFPEAKNHIPAEKAFFLGPIVRDELREGDSRKGMEICRFTTRKPGLLVMGGSQGSEAINQAVRSNLNTLVKTFNVIHLCGKGKVDSSINMSGYAQFEYINQGLADILAITNIAVSRAGSNSIFEFLSLKIPMILIPLTKQASRGDQIMNAESFEKQGFAHVIEEENLSGSLLAETVETVFQNRQITIDKMKKFEGEDGLKRLYELIATYQL